VSYPDFERSDEFVALCPEDEYPMNLGRIRSNRGLNIDQEEFGDAIEERHVEHTTALQAIIKGRGAYLVGPLARLNLNHMRLHPRAAELLPRVCAAIKHDLPWRNNFFSLPARALETVHALALAADLIDAYQPPQRSRIPITPRAGSGGHGTEAPRGICWHHYRLADDGTVTSAGIIPPTSQNQLTIEEDLYQLAEQIVELTDEQAALRCEHLIRNYDPCISCSVHFLKFQRSWRGQEGGVR
jgi:sulfhydrogenase subunit alpha